MRVDVLAEAVPGLGDALAVVDAFDGALAAGLVRPGSAQAAALAALAGAVSGTPLSGQVAEAAGKAAAGAAGEDHFVTLAAARAALLGSAHDALAARVGEATGRPSAEDTAVVPAPVEAVNLPAAARAWLSDLARCGWRGMDHDVVSGAAPVVSALLADPAYRRLGVLLDGFAAELAASCPGSTLERVPERRWADLWSRALLLTLRGTAGPVAAGTVSGRVLPLGIDLHEHATAVQAQVHAVLEPADGGRPLLVRASVSAPKPDTVVGAGLWQLLRPHMALLAAVGEGRAMEVADMPATADGDLLWSDEHARKGPSADPFVTARVVLPATAGAVTAPLDRHPAAIAVPVLLEGYDARQDDGGTVFAFAGHRLAVAVDRVPQAGPLTSRAVLASRACIGLLRWDAGEFAVQPLAVEATVRKKPAAVHAGAWAGGTTDKDGARAEKAATDAVAVLRDRAGRLLRK